MNEDDTLDASFFMCRMVTFCSLKELYWAYEQDDEIARFRADDGILR